MNLTSLLLLLTNPWVSSFRRRVCSRM